jgi:hypothetical protein
VLILNHAKIRAIQIDGAVDGATAVFDDEQSGGPYASRVESLDLRFPMALPRTESNLARAVRKASSGDAPRVGGSSSWPVAKGSNRPDVAAPGRKSSRTRSGSFRPRNVSTNRT